MIESQRIQENVKYLLASIPERVTLQAAAKTRTVEEVLAVISAGVHVIGYNYVQEAERIKSHIDAPVQWHMIGHLQKNKVKKAITIFDMIETLDSVELAQLLDKECKKMDRHIDVLVEINSGEEARKTGVAPEQVESFIRQAHLLENVHIKGLMTMGPWVGEPEELRPYFRRTGELFDHLRGLSLPNVQMIHLSMGMSDSYLVAIEEGATMVRLGTILFGPRVDAKRH